MSSERLGLGLTGSFFLFLLTMKFSELSKENVQKLSDEELFNMHFRAHQQRGSSCPETKRAHDEVLVPEMSRRGFAHHSPMECTGEKGRGLYLVEPHGELIWRGEKTAIAKSRRFDLSGKWILVSGNLAWGRVTLGEPEEVGIEEFERREAEHRVTKEERLRWWPHAEKLWLYPILSFEKYETPRKVRVLPGTQTVMREVVFTDEKQQTRAEGVLQKLEGLPERFVWIPDFVSVTGSTLYASEDREPNDIDVVLRAEADGDGFFVRVPVDASFALKLERVLKDLLGQRRVQYTSTPYGPSWSYVPIYDLCLVRRELLEVVQLSEREPEFAELEYKSSMEPCSGVKSVRQLFGSPGGKHFLARKLVRLIPPHRIYVEPFAGGAALFFRKEASEVEVLGDTDPEIIFTYRFIRDASDDELEKLASQDWKASERRFQELLAKKPGSDLERAYRNLYLFRFGFRKATDLIHPSDFRHADEGRTADFSLARLKRTRERLRGVRLREQDAVKTVGEFDSPETFFYLDPPYPSEKDRPLWSGHETFNLDALFQTLKGVKGKFILSLGLADKDAVPNGFHLRRVKTRRQLSKTQPAREAYELLISNFDFSEKALTLRALDRKLRGASDEVKKQAYQTWKEDRVEPGRMVLSLKPLRPAPAGKRQTVDRLYEYIEEHLNFPLYLSAKRDGATHYIHSNGEKIWAFSDDGQDNTEKLPHIVEALKRNFGDRSFVFGTEIELWREGNHYPREATTGAVKRGEDEDLALNIFRVLYWDGQDLHREPFEKVWEIAQTLPVDSQEDGALYPKRDGPINLVPHYKVHSLGELKAKLEEVAYKPGVEGVVVKRADGPFPLDGEPGHPPTEVKWHKSFGFKATVSEKEETKTRGVYVYTFRLDDMEVGKTFGSALDVPLNSTLEMEGEQLNVEYDEGGNIQSVSVWAPEVIGESGEEPDSLKAVIARAKRHGVLREKVRKADGTVTYLPNESGDPATASKAGVEDYPDEDEKLRYVAQLHFRGRSVHLDFRAEFKRGAEHYLRGWTIAVQKPDAIREPVTTLEEAKEIARDSDVWKLDLRTGVAKPRQIRGGVIRRGDLRAFEKAAEIPSDWLEVEGVTEQPDPGEPVPVGATRQYPGVFLIVARGEVAWGAQKPWFSEFFLDGDWKGRWTFRLIQRKGQEVLPPGVEEEDERTGAYWVLLQPEDQTPYVLSKEAMEADWLPPKGVSALPPAIRKSVPEHLRYWEQEGERALASRRELATKYEELGGPELKARILPFTLVRRDWKGQVVIRFGPSTTVYDLWIGDWRVSLAGNPLEDDDIAALPASRGSKVKTPEGEVDLLSMERGQVVEVVPGTKFNPTKATPCRLEVIDRGEAQELIAGETHRKVELRGEKLKGVWFFGAEDEREPKGFWLMSRSSGPEVKEKMETGDWFHSEEGRKALERACEKGTAGFAFPGRDGRTWWFQFTTNAFQDREGEIFSTKSLEELVNRSRGREKKGEFWYRHIPGTRFGEVQWQALIGRFLAQAGPFDSTPVGDAFREFFSTHPLGHPEIAPEGWGASHKYYFNRDDKGDRVYEWLEIIESSVLPAHIASNPWNRIISKEVYEMTEEERKDLEVIGGRTLVEMVEELGRKETKRLEEEGVSFKALDILNELRAIAEELEDEELKKRLGDVIAKLESYPKPKEKEAEEKGLMSYLAEELEALAEAVGGETGEKLRRIADALRKVDAYPRPGYGYPKPGYARPPYPSPQEAYPKPEEKALTREEVAEALKQLVESLRSEIETTVKEAIEPLAKQVQALERSDAEKIASMIEVTPAASLDAMVKGLFGDSKARVDGRSALAKQGPAEAEPREAAVTGIPLLDRFISGTDLRGGS